MVLPGGVVSISGTLKEFAFVLNSAWGGREERHARGDWAVRCVRGGEAARGAEMCPRCGGACEGGEGTGDEKGKLTLRGGDQRKG
jgi:hypothetical protein